MPVVAIGHEIKINEFRQYTLKLKNILLKIIRGTIYVTHRPRCKSFFILGPKIIKKLKKREIKILKDVESITLENVVVKKLIQIH